ncbi:tumor necrosis factor receptor superfamily member 18 [Crocuta crocuta]
MRPARVPLWRPPVQHLQAPPLPARPGGSADRRQRPLSNGEGNFNFGFECVDCVAGTFSGGHEGRCKPWADCSQFGLPTAFPGNKTHNAVCSLGLLPAEPQDPLTAALLTMAACVLVLTAAQLGLHIWQLRRQRVWPPETQPLLEAGPPAEDARSCQFPEEERGEQLPEDKGQPRDLWV